MNKKRLWENWINLFLGVWILLTPYIFKESFQASGAVYGQWNLLLTGLVLIFSAAKSLQALKPWEEWVSMFLGTWLVLSGWIFGYVSDPKLFLNTCVVGGLITVFSAVALPEAQRAGAR